MQAMRTEFWKIATLALVLGIASASRAATVLTSCGTISAPGDYVLEDDLTAAGNCFSIDADNVTLDFQGHTLTGNGTGYAVQDLASGNDGVIITNGSITGFEWGIQLYESTLITIDRMGIANVTSGIGTGEATVITKTSITDATSQRYQGRRPSKWSFREVPEHGFPGHRDRQHNRQSGRGYYRRGLLEFGEQGALRSVAAAHRFSGYLFLPRALRGFGSRVGSSSASS